jgi:hypothetical protein
MRQAARQVVADLDRLPQAAAVIRSPVGAGGSALVSATRRSALVTFQVPGPADSQVTAVAPAVRAVAAVQASADRHGRDGRAVPDRLRRV